MIQRIQTLYLFLAAILTGLTLILPVGTFLGGTEELRLTAFGFFDTAGNTLVVSAYGLTATVMAATILALVDIFLYKRRLVQFRLCIVELVLLMGVIIFEGYYVSGSIRSLASFEVSAWKLSLGAFLPLISLVLSYLALRGIRKDIQLVKSLDRIR